jgi:hypothetical protein
MSLVLGCFLSACAAKPTPSAAPPAPTAASATPGAAVVILHEVADYKTWRPVFDEDATNRKRPNITQVHVNQSIDNPNLVAVYLAADKAASIQEFAADPALKTAMRKAGVKSEPTVVAMTPTEDHTIKDRPLAGAIIRFSVTSYDTWKQEFDGNAGARERAGIVGDAVNRVVADPNTLVVYLQAESLDALRTFTSSPELRATQQRAGVQGPPQITFWQGGPWTN